MPTPTMGTMSGRRIGLLGGTFDPPHVGHLVTAVEVLEQLRLDAVLLVVANDPWQKSATRPVTAAEHRLAMVRAAVDGVEGVECSDMEIRRGGPSYTVDTLEELHADEPDVEVHLILGADAAAGLATWKRHERVAELAELVVVGRRDVEVPPPAGFRVRRVDVPRLDVSSTDLRERLRSGRSVRWLIPDGVLPVVHERRLYGVRR